LKGSPSHQANTVDAKYLWRKRLGQPSSEILSYLLDNLGIDCGLNKNKEDFCDVCFHAKQTLSSFPISQNNAKDVVDLICYDILGPYRVPSFCGAHYFLSIVNDTNRAM